MSHALTPVQELAQNPFIAIANRGGHLPEPNTPAAYAFALKQGCNWLSTSVHLSEAGLLAYHGDNLQPLIQEDLKIEDITPDIRQELEWDHDLYIPTLAELLRVVPKDQASQVVWNIDCPESEAAEPLLAVIEEARLFGNVVLRSFNQQIANELRAGSPDHTATALTRREGKKLYSGRLRERPAAITFAQLPVTYGRVLNKVPVTVPIISKNLPIAREATRLGMDTHAWAEPGSEHWVDTEQGIKDLAKLGCKGVFTNHVPLARRVIKTLRV